MKKVETYPHLVNAAAFIDKVVVNVWGIRRKKTTGRTVEQCNLAIGGPGRVYARCSRRRSTASGNRLQFVYGVLRPYPNASPYKLAGWAGKRPAMCADCLLSLGSLMRQGYRASVSAVELAFDIDVVPLDQFTEELCTRATIRSFKKTFYVGRVNSAWQVKFYQRTESVGRIEFTFNSTFLRKHGIRRVEELYLLRRLRLWDLISFREVDQSQGHKLPARIKVTWEWLDHGLPPPFPASIVMKSLREARVDPSRWVVRSPREALLRKMQRNLVW